MLLAHLKLDGTAKNLKATMPSLEQIEDALVTSAVKVKHTTRAQRTSSLCKKPPELKLAQDAIFAAEKGLERQQARKQ